MWAAGLSRSLDYAATRRDLDLGASPTMASAGAAPLGPILAAVEPRVRAVCSSAAGSSSRTRCGVDPLNFAPHVLQPTLMINGRYDFFFPVETSQQPLFALLGVKPSDKRHIVVDGGHYPPQDLLVKETSTGSTGTWGRAVAHKSSTTAACQRPFRRAGERHSDADALT